MSGASKSNYHHGDLRRALIAAALSLIEERGVEGCSLREAARRAGVSHAAPYRHFADHRALVASAAAEGFVILQRRIASRARRARAAEAKLRAWGSAYVAFALDRPALFQVMFGRPIDQADHPEASVAADRLFEELVALIEACRAEGDVGGAVEARRAARLGWAMMHGIAQLALAGQLEFERRQQVLDIAQDAAAHLLAGLR